MKTVESIEAIIKKYNSEAIIAPGKNKVFFCTNFPEPVEQPILDFIDCHYEVIEQNQFSIRFRQK